MWLSVLLHILLSDCIQQSVSQSHAMNNIDFVVGQFRKHRTIQFYGDFAGERNVIIRRGDIFNFAVELNRVSGDEHIEIQLSFVTKIDRMVVSLPRGAPLGWSMTQSLSGRRVNVEVRVPGNAPVGVWSLNVILRNNRGSIVDRVESPNPIVILFNPWSREDAVFFPDENKLNEYILNEKGYSYHYKYEDWERFPWIYGQFQPHVLDAVLFALGRGRLSAAQRGDVILVARELTYLMNDDGVYNRGVLQGKWKEPFGPIDGRKSTKPWEWNGSPSILKQFYFSGGQTVGYGQCWVFAGILTTGYRALGIPARTVSNFLSAKSKERDLTLDIHLDEDDFIRKKESDGLWNYHVWVQAWFTRPDLGYEYNGWQELDATPQEINDGRFQVGPASSRAIRQARVRHRFQSDFIYEEVNADEVVWSHKNEIVAIHRDKIGLALLTKQANGDGHEDITSMYKPPENTAAERESYRTAASLLGVRPPSLQPSARAAKHPVLIQFSVPRKIAVGSPIPVQVLITNPSTKAKSLRIGFKATSMYYNGYEVANLKLQRMQITMPPLRKETIKFTINPQDYWNKLSDSYTIRLQMAARSGNSLAFEKKYISLVTPRLMIESPKVVRLNETFSVGVKFKNPLGQKLRNCHIVVEGTGIDRSIFKVKDIDPFSTGGATLNLRSLYPNLETIVVNLYASNLKEIRGSTQLRVNGQRKHKFAMIPLSQIRGPKPLSIKGLEKSVHSFIKDLNSSFKLIEF